MLEKCLKWITWAAMAILVAGCVLGNLNTRPTPEPGPQSGLLAGKNSKTIPRLDLEGPIHNMGDKHDVRKIMVSYQDETGSFRSCAKLTVQGASSLDYEKKNYTVKFFADKGYENRRTVDFGWGDQSQYCLKANWVDKTHARNLVSAQLAAEIQERYGVLTQAPNFGQVDGFPVEVYANGDFLGLYTLNIPKDAWMLGMDKGNPDHLAFISQSWSPAAAFDELPDYRAWAIEAGEKNEENLEKLARLSRFVMESSDEEFREQQSEYFDLDAAINYIILCEFGLMDDNSVKNMLMATYDGKVWYPILYDMDSSWGTDWSGLELHNYELLSLASNSSFLGRVKDVFNEEFVRRYFELREDILTKEHIMDLFQAFEDRIPASVWERERATWRNIPGYDYAQIEEFLDVRIPCLDAYMCGRMQEK